MNEPICPSCDGNGITQVFTKLGKGVRCEVYVGKWHQCPTCSGSGIATNDEVKEFFAHLTEEK